MSAAPIERFEGPNRFLSNFQPVMVAMDGRAYPSVENAYQALKFHPSLREEFEKVLAPRAKLLGGRRTSLPAEWETERLNVMLLLNAEKFFPQTRMAELLLATGDAELVEGNSWGDRFWGVCNGAGDNHLGRILMRIRRRLVEPSRHRRLA
jgi:ribA/ribD-fused uncharacterized protein